MLFYGFNEARNNTASSYLRVGDKYMSEICFCKTAKGNLPHLSYIFRKPEPLGTSFNTVACYVTEAFLFIELQRRREGMKHSKYQQQLGATAACTKRMMETTKRIATLCRGLVYPPPK